MTQMRRCSESDLNRIRDFVEHLLANPGINSEPVIIGEKLIMNFIAMNTPALKKTFKNPQFFPKLEWQEVIELIFTDLYNRISADVLPRFNRFTDTSDLSFFDSLSGTGVVADDHRRTRLHEFVQMLFKDRNVRFQMQPVDAIFRYDAIDRYITAIFRRRGYIYNELVRVQGINLDVNDYINLTKVAVLIRSAANYRFRKGEEGTSSGLILDEVPGNRKSLTAYTESLAGSIMPLLPGIPVQVISIAIRSNLPAGMTGNEEALSRFIFILCSMFRTYRHLERIDRGADTPEKSWFGAARRNYSESGYDRRLIESLYMIAGDNNW